MAESVTLDVQDLEVVYEADRGEVHAVDHVNFQIAPGEFYGLAGESGSGKSTVAFAITRLLKAPAVVKGGRILLGGRDLISLPDEEFKQLRWKEISIVFQSAMHSLNPVLTIGEQIVDAIQAHERIPREQALRRAGELLEFVHVESSRLHAYPHQLSGGMRQRAVIAMALAFRPRLLIMDEPTTALDVVVQKQILHELKELRQTFNFSLLYITHDVSLLVEMADRIGIMYAGRLVESAPTETLLHGPSHPYTAGLIASFPSIHGERRTLTGIPGSPPDLIDLPAGCPFHPRCPQAEEQCRTKEPAWTQLDARHGLRCHLFAHGREAVNLPKASGGDD